MPITCSYEKQDILYNRIRHCLEQEKLARFVWYDEEYHSKKKHKWVHFDTFAPDNSKSKYPIESLVLSESYSSDEPLDIRECQINEFWDYLFSEDWSEGSSLRVLKGRLQDQIVLCLAHMKKVGIITHHRTFACAVNLRRKQCNKNQSDIPVN
ncbi:hypothetical protein ACJMK2_035206 [Sinanodonta woodiana]|uniref:Uncharacterized protein n=1 Tax=Sinanodonta woodiana TaxID=1069815 RepID=A0ABD3WXM6_SINWO